MSVRRCMACLALVTAGLAAVSAPAKAAGPALQTLEPGAFREIAQNLTVNVVLVGFDRPGLVDTAALQAALPASYRSIHRYANFYGRKEPTGNRFAFQYRVVKAGPAYADALFGYLGSIATAQPRTLFQNLYNAQPGKALAVAQNHAIDAPSTETWLANNPPPGIDTGSYTVYLINGFGRPDFKFHVYTKTDVVDPDTGYNFGVNRASRKLVAWGGTPRSSGPARRVWFYDFSAGPESFNGNYNISDADLDGDGVADYRIPPIWEYGSYRAASALTADAARLTRFVAINLLFTTSPLYKPAISAPKLPSTVNIDLNLFQGDPTSDARTLIKPAEVVAQLGRLQSHNRFTAGVRAYPLDNSVARVLNCFTFGPSCYGNKLGGANFGDLFLYAESHLLQYLDGSGDYEVPVFHFNVINDLAGGLLGFADDNWRDGTQSFVFGFDAPALRAAGYGFTTTTTHEVGHHLGMSHPHDGYDSELDLDYSAGGNFYYAWSGDESNTIMSYIDLSLNFSQFDQDNMDRWMTAAYINQANVILAKITASPRAAAAGALLLAADSAASQALARYAAMDYRNAVAQAKTAYLQVLSGAAAANVKVEPQAWQADFKAKGKSDKFIDRVDYVHRLAP